MIDRGAAAAVPSALTSVGWSVTVRLSDGRRATVETGRFGASGRSAPGIVLVPAEAFRRVEGMHSGLLGWGWEDVDLLLRLRLVTGLRRREWGRAVHLPHPPAEGAAASEAANRNACLARYASGDLHGTMQLDCARWTRRAA